MSVESDFGDTVKICEFYADPCETFEVDLEDDLDSYFQRVLDWEAF
jgi:hypothetical protein